MDKASKISSMMIVHRLTEYSRQQEYLNRWELHQYHPSHLAPTIASTISLPPVKHTPGATTTTKVAISTPLSPPMPTAAPYRNQHVLASSLALGTIGRASDDLGAGPWSILPYLPLY